MADAALSRSGRLLALTSAFLGWFFAGGMMSITSLAMQPAAVDLLGRSGAINQARYLDLVRLAPKDGDLQRLPPEDAGLLRAWRAMIQRWFGYFTCAWLFGAATGGLVFGRLGDRFGRTRAMAASILCYSLVPLAVFFVQSPIQLLVLWFLACMGVGGIWPNGVALVSECWSSLSRPAAAGIIGMSANIGIFLMATLAGQVRVTPDHWRWMMLVAGVPAVVGLFVLLAVPESPRWLAARSAPAQESGEAPSLFRSPYWRFTLVGIVLATVPMIGGWGSANWMIPWAGEAGAAAVPPDPFLKAHVGQARALTGIVGSLLGGWLASLAGRRRSFCLISLGALICAQFTFWALTPTDASFLVWVGALGFFSGLYFGWLPLFLPELFPTRVRSTGAGVSFNFGRILTAATVFLTASLTDLFHGDYARMGRATSLIFVVGMIAIWFAPDTSEKQMDD